MRRLFLALLILVCVSADASAACGRSGARRTPVRTLLAAFRPKAVLARVQHAVAPAKATGCANGSCAMPAPPPAKK